MIGDKRIRRVTTEKNVSFRLNYYNNTLVVHENMRILF